MAPKPPNDIPLVTGYMISPVDDDDEFGLRQPLSKPARRLRRKIQTKTLQGIIKKNAIIQIIKTK